MWRERGKREREQEINSERERETDREREIERERERLVNCRCVLAFGLKERATLSQFPFISYFLRFYFPNQIYRPFSCRFCLVYS